MKTIIACALLAATPVLAEDPSYASHKGVQLYTTAPCTAVIEVIDSEGPEFPTEAEHFFYGTENYSRSMGQWMSAQGMAWGFILGFDTANGGLHSDTETTLQRLRTACEEEPSKTAYDLLSNMGVAQR